MITRLIRWLAPSMQGTDGKASARALTNLWYVLLNTAISVAVVVLAFRIVDQSKPTLEAVSALKALILLCVIHNLTVLILFGIITIQQVTQGIRAFKGQDKSDESPINSPL